MPSTKRSITTTGPPKSFGNSAGRAASARISRSSPACSNISPKTDEQWIGGNASPPENPDSLPLQTLMNCHAASIAARGRWSPGTATSNTGSTSAADSVTNRATARNSSMVTVKSPTTSGMDSIVPATVWTRRSAPGAAIPLRGPPGRPARLGALARCCAGSRPASPPDAPAVRHFPHGLLPAGVRTDRRLPSSSRLLTGGASGARSGSRTDVGTWFSQVPLLNRLIERSSFGGQTIAPSLSASPTTILMSAMVW